MRDFTHTEFSMQASFMAAEASRWAAEVLEGSRDKPMSDWAMERFLGKMRERLDRIEKWHNETKPTPITEGEK